MWFSHAAIVSTLAAVALSQSIHISRAVSQIPSCSLSCLTTAITGAGCGLTDYACQCGAAKAAIAEAVNPCVLKSCSTSDAFAVQRLNADICGAQAASGVVGLARLSPVLPPSPALPIHAEPMHVEMRDVSRIGSMIGTVIGSFIPGATKTSTVAINTVLPAAINTVLPAGTVLGAFALPSPKATATSTLPSSVASTSASASEQSSLAMATSYGEKKDQTSSTSSGDEVAPLPYSHLAMVGAFAILAIML